ncbi:MAG: outer membrane beta-barrel protein [Bacteroidales bacterium]|nr:outer membrane beta-barrel protein [Bacteroidales bacterium]
MKKNYQIVSKALLIALLFIIPVALLSQNANREEGSDKLYYQWYINLNGGITQSFCDIQSGSFHLDQLQGDAIAPSFGARLGKHISPVFGIYGSFMTGKLQGFNDDRQLEFETDINYDAILGGTLSFSNLIFGYKPRLVNVYGTAGLGLASFTPTTYQRIDGERGPRVFDILDPATAEDKTEINNTTEAMYPVGIGVDFRINNRWDINFESTLRLFDSDKLDGYISGNKNDAYYYTSLGVGYSFWRPSSGGKMDIETEPTILALHGDSIPIEIKGKFPDSYNKRAVVEFTPELRYGTQSKTLETMYFQGTDVTEENQKPGAMVISEDGGSFTYKTYVPYEPGMDVCELYVEPMLSVKGRTPSSMGDRKLADGLIMTSKRITNTEKVLLADHGYQRNIVVNQMGTIYYIVNRHQLNFNFKLNKTDEAKAARENLKEFVDKGWEIRNISVNAWASPEGEESFNQGLSQRRSESAKKWIADVYASYVKQAAKEKGVSKEEIEQEIKYDLEAHGEDWDGFMDALKKSDIKDKNIIANVVNSQPDLKKREQEIRNMTVIYKEIEDEILPPLRRSEINVFAYEPSLSDDEIAQLSTTNPDSLNIHELLYAATLTDDNEAKMNIYKTVIDQYPDDWRGYNNAGKVSVEMGDYNAAENYFAKAKSKAANNGVVLNNTGAMASKEKDFAKAKDAYMAAQKQGVNVNYNMGIVKIAEGNYNGAINSLGSEKCDYNLALAHVLSGNYNAATSTLNCAEKTAQVYYLQAVIGARTNNDNMVYENLKKAIAADKSYAKTAMEDKEFMKYYTNPEFMNIVK